MKYHFYFDEGGMLGNATVRIKKGILNKYEILSGSDGDIRNYYFGKIPMHSIIRHLQLFQMAYPDCIINYDSQSDIKDLDLTIKGGM